MLRLPGLAQRRHPVPVVEAGDDAGAHRVRHRLGLVARAEGAHQRDEVLARARHQERQRAGGSGVDQQLEALGSGERERLGIGIPLSLTGRPPVLLALADPGADREAELGQLLAQVRQHRAGRRRRRVAAPGREMRLVGEREVGQPRRRLPDVLGVGEELLGRRRVGTQRAQHLRTQLPALVGRAAGRALYRHHCCPAISSTPSSVRERRLA
jgi:hypothetical protein